METTVRTGFVEASGRGKDGNEEQKCYWCRRPVGAGGVQFCSGRERRWSCGGCPKKGLPRAAVGDVVGCLSTGLFRVLARVPAG